LKQLNVGILGLGTVGGGTYTVLTRNADEITRRTGISIKVTQVADKNLTRVNEITAGKVAVTDDAFNVVNNPEIDVVVELIGGNTIAKELILKAIANKKHVVTANKALIAVHGDEIFAAAKKKWG
jgi:homoserine dehydrogenase